MEDLLWSSFESLGALSIPSLLCRLMNITHNGKEQYISLYDNLQVSTVPFVCVYVNIIFNLDSSLLLLAFRRLLL